MLRSKEIFMAERQAGNYCTKCRTNWAALHTQDDEQGDESYEYCPTCRTDTWLAPFKENEPRYYASIDKGIINVDTGIALQTSAPLPIKKKVSSKPYNREEWVRQEEAKERHQDERINEYRKNCESMTHDEAMEIYVANPILAHYDVEAIIIQ